MKEVLDEHYTRLADEYNHFLYYSDDFMRTLTKKMIEMLDLKTDDHFVDLCGGTGLYTLDILKQIQLKNKTLSVDAYQQMLDQIPKDTPTEKLCMDAFTFSEQTKFKYNKVLIKEAIHHVSERETLFRNLYHRLPKGGRLLLVHVPPNVQYPIFQKALDRALGWHANPNELEKQLKTVGFRVERDFVAYPHKISKDHYFKQVESQFMSVLTSFSGQEIKEGLKEMDRKYGNQEFLEFIDHFDCLTGIKET